MTNLEKAKRDGWEFFKETNHWTGFKNGGTERNCTTKACVSKEEAANEALNIDYRYHRKKECHVWVETDDPAKGGKQGGRLHEIDVFMEMRRKTVFLGPYESVTARVSPDVILLDLWVSIA